MEQLENWGKKVQDEFANKLSEATRKVIDSYEIPCILDEITNPDRSITIVLSRAPKTKSKKSKKSTANIKIAYSFELNFDVEELLKSDSLLDFNLMFNMLRPELVAPITNKIAYWSRGLFKEVSKIFTNYGIELQIFPFQLFFDEEDNIILSKLPKFENLKFVDSNNPNLLLNSADVVLKHAEAVQDIASIMKHF